MTRTGADPQASGSITRMTDPRYVRLAQLLVEYSTKVKRGDVVFLDVIDVPDEFPVELMRAVRAAGGTPVIEARHTRLTREIMRGTDAAHARLLKELEMFRMKRVQAYIAVRGSTNANEASDVPAEKLQLYSKTLRPVID